MTMKSMKFKNANKVASIEEGFGWGAGYRIYLKDGWSFLESESECENMRGFDTMAEAIKAIRDVYPCACKDCRDALDRLAANDARAA